MRYKLIFDRSIPVDSDEIPEDIIVHADDEGTGFEMLADELATVDPDDIYPIEDVLCNSRSLKEDFDYYLFNAR